MMMNPTAFNPNPGRGQFDIRCLVVQSLAQTVKNRVAEKLGSFQSPAVPKPKHDVHQDKPTVMPIVAMASSESVTPTIVAAPRTVPTISNPMALTFEATRPTPDRNSPEPLVLDGCPSVPGCKHTDWKHLRSRRGYAYFACFQCGVKWRTRYAIPAKRSDAGGMSDPFVSDHFSGQRLTSLSTVNGFVSNVRHQLPPTQPPPPTAPTASALIMAPTPRNPGLGSLIVPKSPSDQSSVPSAWDSSEDSSQTSSSSGNRNSKTSVWENKVVLMF